ncbi:MAG: hypothetical protein R6X22_12080 [Gemmatimonadota bacterium]
MKAQIVFARVGDGRRGAYLKAWTEWTGTLFTMGIRTQLFESAGRPGEFTEITWFAEGQEAALADDRLVRVNDALGAAAEERTGALKLHALVA